MGRNRKPAELVAIDGSLEHDRKRYSARLHAPKKSNPLGNPPSHLPATQKKLWKELVKNTPAGVLTVADRFLVELTTGLLFKMRTGDISTGETSQLVSCLSRMGLTPSDRSKVSADAPDTRDDLEMFMNGTGTQ